MAAVALSPPIPLELALSTTIQFDMDGNQDQEDENDQENQQTVNTILSRETEQKQDSEEQAWCVPLRPISVQVGRTVLTLLWGRYRTHRSFHFYYLLEDPMHDGLQIPEIFTNSVSRVRVGHRWLSLLEFIELQQGNSIVRLQSQYKGG